MASALEGRKGPDDEGTINVASKKASRDKQNGFIKLKKPPPKQSKPGNWRDGSVLEDDKKKKRSESPAAILGALSPGPVVNQLEDSTRESFETGRPLDDPLPTQQCKHCKKVVLKPALPDHIDECLKKKKEKAQKKKEAREARERLKVQAARSNNEGDGDAKAAGSDDDDDDEDGPPEKKAGKKNVSGKKVGGEPKGKKRKADGDPEKGPKSKKKKEEPKPKAPKAKGPVDVEKQCGVILANGQPCARSLTCKSHSMGAKRAVAGRSLPYDMLLAAYQKKNQAKQQKAALDANAPLEDDEANEGPIDSEEETAQVMGALKDCWNPQPVVPQEPYEPLREKYRLNRLHEQLMIATNGGRTNIFKVVGLGAQRLPPNHVVAQNMDMEDAPGEPDLSVPGTRRLSGINQA
ncbi:SCA7, zinc-binding domain-containing protein [Pseudomassariella vexata]|uniref:SCA7, zinc-binding domain-domain-containing protein n=1 Tax=Pseudomassariella vexata TaxID=1141098 RepID=A0A1Y2EE95_9PEZI|nr:SCA7, zinc-binding domain-containing protein [Pseudomassariella vexata]ORY69903.1 SCA7, zinc-binding domain-domain-containing protein [Pseudomassariella vexata]